MAGKKTVKTRTARCIGVLGGSFNPAHAGHLHISKIALKRLRLDEVWWLVSPQNPLKPEQGMAEFQHRYDYAQQMADDPRIRVSDWELRLGTRHTADTLRLLRDRCRDCHFVWLMGADNLAQIHHWRNWRHIFATVPVAVFARPGYDLSALAGRAAKSMARIRRKVMRASTLVKNGAPGWIFFPIRHHWESATRLRARAVKPLRTLIPHQQEDLNIMQNKMAPLSSQALCAVATTSLEDGKAQEIVTIDLRGKSSIADYMVIASGASGRQVAALADRLLRDLKNIGQKRLGVEGQERGDWVLVDAGDVIIHLFRPEVRIFYNLEKMWSADLPGER